MCIQLKKNSQSFFCFTRFVGMGTTTDLANVHTIMTVMPNGTEKVKFPFYYFINKM